MRESTHNTTRQKISQAKVITVRSLKKVQRVSNASSCDVDGDDDGAKTKSTFAEQLISGANVINNW